MSISYPNVHERHETESEWEKIYSRDHDESWATVVPFEFENAVEIKPGERRGLCVKKPIVLCFMGFISFTNPCG